MVTYTFYYTLNWSTFSVLKYYISHFSVWLEFLKLLKFIERRCTKRVVNFYLGNNKSKSGIVAHFAQERIPDQTLYFIMATYEKHGTYLPRSGRLTGLDPNKIGRLINSKNWMRQRRKAFYIIMFASNWQRWLLYKR